MEYIRNKDKKERGIALFWVAAVLVLLLAFSGLAIDLGRGYLVKAHLSKAVDGAALAAARVIGNGQSAATTEANKIFRANFPDGFLGVRLVPNPYPPSLAFSTDAEGSNVIDVSSTAAIDTTFMRIAGFNNLTVRSSSQAARRLVDMSLVIDKSGSIGSDWPLVQAAATDFVESFDDTQDRISLIMYSSNTVVFDPINTGRGFNKSSLTGHIAAGTSQGFTATSEGLYRGWDELRRVPSNTQSGLRVIVLFTDGSPNSWSGNFTVAPGSSAAQGVINTNDFPAQGGNSTNTPQMFGLTQTLGTPSNPANQSLWSGQSTASSNIDLSWTGTPRIDFPLPTQSFHPTPSSAGIPTQFNLVDSSLVGGDRPVGTAPTVRNMNNAARNLVEIIANQARSDTSGAHRIRIYTLGLGVLLTLPGGAPMERGDDILKRIANDPSSPNFNPAQKPGQYFFAGDATQLDAAFKAIRSQITRLTE